MKFNRREIIKKWFTWAIALGLSPETVFATEKTRDNIENISSLKSKIKLSKKIIWEEELNYLFSFFWFENNINKFINKIYQIQKRFWLKKDWIVWYATLTFIYKFYLNKDYTENFYSSSYKNIYIENSEENYELPFMWTNRVYLTINWKKYWEYIWNQNLRTYVLDSHKDGELKLKIKSNKNYNITTITNKNIDLNNDLSNPNLDNDSIENLFGKYTANEFKINKLEANIITYLEKKIENLWIKDWEYFYYLDKSLQRSFLCTIENNQIKILWYDKISTWNPARNHGNKSKYRYFETPYSIIDRSERLWQNKKVAKLDWRAEWTDSKWYGDKWSKIFFLWWYDVDKKWNSQKLNSPENADMHLVMHTTTPRGITQLWKKMSHGCIRISPFSVKLLDKLWLINWEKWRYVIIWNYN